MGILINIKHRSLRFIGLLLITLLVDPSIVHCQNEQQTTIKILGQVYVHVPQIPQEQYSVVPQVLVTQQTNPVTGQKFLVPPPNHRFNPIQKADYFVAQSSDSEHQAKRYNFIKGKNIFTPSYINTQVLDSAEETVTNSKELSTLSNTLREQFNKNFEELKEKEQTKSKQKQAQITVDSTERKKQQVIEQKSSEIYNEFKNMELLKKQNLRDDQKNQAEQQRFHNMIKLCSYIVVGLVISFAILKKVTKSPDSSIPKANQERTELRLRDTADDEDDEDVSSSDSDQ